MQHKHREAVDPVALRARYMALGILGPDPEAGTPVAVERQAMADLKRQRRIEMYGRAVMPISDIDALYANLKRFFSNLYFNWSDAVYLAEAIERGETFMVRDNHTNAVIGKAKVERKNARFGQHCVRFYRLAA